MAMAWKICGGLGALLVASATVACSPVANDSTSASDELNARASDSTGFGPMETTSSEYQLPATTDPDILADRKTEVWARVYRPAQLASGEKHPLLVFLHGNHGTCGRGSNPRIDDNTQYTSSGTCPNGYVVAPNHLGYAYVAERLASWGYIVVSINANRGITAGSGASGDSGLNLARGRLILKHLQLLSEWNATAGTTPESLGFDLAGTLDFSNVGMMGHSRGGEGVRAAYTQYHDPGSPWPNKIREQLQVKAMFEIGPVDGQTSRQLNALGTAWNVILPMCDGDVSNLQGMKPFDRMLAASSESNATPKGMFAVWGANHNFYNTEWQTSDSRRCGGVAHNPLWETGAGIVGSAKQQTTGLHAMMGFFRAHVGQNAQPALNHAYDPQYALPESLEAITRIERAYTDAAHASMMKIVEDFTKPAGTSLSGAPTVVSNATVTHRTVPEHDALLKAAAIQWTAPSAESFFQVPFAEGGVDASQMKTLDFRASRQTGVTDPAAAIDLSVRLVNVDGSLSSPVALKDYLVLAPAGGHVTMETARIPLGAFENVDLAKVAGVRWTFDGTANGGIYLSSVRFSRATPPPTSIADSGRPTPITDVVGPPETVTVTTGNSVVDLRAVGPDEVEIEVASQTQFPVLDDLAVLRVGDHDLTLSRFADDGDTHRLIFRVPAGEFGQLADGAPMVVQYGAERATRAWPMGRLQKGNVRR